MKICFIAAGGRSWGSSRMRAYWVAEALRERGHETYTVRYETAVSEWQTLTGCDAYIWQKTVDLDTVAKLDGRHYLDVCDPSWWWQPNECREIAKHMTAVVASSPALAADFNQWYGEDLAICIPDRLNMAHFTKQRQHTAVSPVRFIWFGVAVNRIALLGAIPFLERLVANGYKIELTICDDRPDQLSKWSDAFPIYHTQWTLQSEVQTLAAHDVALLPPYPGAWGKVKSNNKALTAWACGLPVCGLQVSRATDYPELEELMNPSGRQKLAKGGMMLLEDGYTIDKSAAEWEALLHGSL